MLAAALLLAPAAVEAGPRHHHSSGHHSSGHHGRSHHAAAHKRHAKPVWPIEIPGGQYAPVKWDQVAGWDADDHLAAFRTFRESCRPIVARRKPVADTKALGSSLAEPCRAARAAEISDAAHARRFFERHFLPLQISRVGEDAGFVTGYYEPIVDGSRVKTDVYNVPVYRRPSNLFVRGYSQGVGLPNGGPVYRKIGRRKLVPYYDRAEIEDGAIAGRGLEICWLKSQTDLLFSQIQGSARVRLEDGSFVRINYDAHNGYPYTPVGRILIDRGIIPKEQMSMQRIREWMDANPDGAGELRRANRSYVFFREVKLKDDDEAVGAQGVPLTPGRSIAVDKALHVYGTPFFITGELPVAAPDAKTPFRRLMVAQDTGSAIIGPARADLYFGAGTEAGAVAGRMRHPIRFVMLLPNSLDPVARGRTMPLPEPRPSARIAKLYPQTPAGKDKPAVQDSPKAPEAATNDKPAAATAGSAQAVPTPQARPDAAPVAAPKRTHRRHHRHRRHR
ncbi:murein transglycosylase A [Rhodopseudomonas palustris]|uniref:murein transglycosylase A n=1 Tax=Rhodopseudomonas palustris TaxID=1076 RepID=UPI002ACEF6DA|nr:murein transglycosylase A [Rhodopseudomonas palustris]WQG98639.1 murein transglycosylase A [Rhodopseudomonas palustris]